MLRSDTRQYDPSGVAARTGSVYYQRPQETSVLGLTIHSQVAYGAGRSGGQPGFPPNSQGSSSVINQHSRKASGDSRASSGRNETPYDAHPPRRHTNMPHDNRTSAAISHHQFSQSETTPDPSSPMFKNVSSAYASKRASMQSVNSRSSVNTSSTTKSSIESAARAARHSSIGTLDTLATSQIAPSSESLERRDSMDKRYSFVGMGMQPYPSSSSSSSRNRSGELYADPHGAPAHSSVSSLHRSSTVSSTHTNPPLPLPNSDYETSTREKVLRRVKGPSIQSSDSGALREAMDQASSNRNSRYEPSRSSRQDPPAKDQAKKSAQKSNDLRHALLSRLSGSAVPRTRESHTPFTVPGHAPSAPSPHGSSEPVESPEMIKLKQTSIPPISSTLGASPSTPTSRASVLQSPRNVDKPLQQPISSISGPRSAVDSPMSHAPSILPTLADDAQSSYGTPRARLASPIGSEHLLPSINRMSMASPRIASAISPDDPPRTPTPTSRSAQVRQLFSPLVSRHPTPHPNRNSVINIKRPVSVALSAVESSRVMEAIPPPLPPTSTRPDAYVHKAPDAHKVIDPYPRAQTVDPPSTSLVLASTAQPPPPPTAPPASRQSAQEPKPTLRTYGLDSPRRASSAMPAASVAGPTTYTTSTVDVQTDSEIRVTTEVISVTKSTVVSSIPANGGPPTMQIQTSTRTVAASNNNQDNTTYYARGDKHHQQSMDIPIPPAAARQFGSSFLDKFRSKTPTRMQPPSSESIPQRPPSAARSTARSPTPQHGARKGLFNFKLFPKPKKSHSGASIEAVIGRERLGMHDAGRSSESSFCATDVPPSPPLRETMQYVHAWRDKGEQYFRQSGKPSRVLKPGVTFELPNNSGGEDRGTEGWQSDAPSAVY